MFLITAEIGPGVRHICSTLEQVAGGHGGAFARVPARRLLPGIATETSQHAVTAQHGGL